MVGAAAEVGVRLPDARMVYVAERAARLEVSMATLATREALLSMSCDNVLQLLVGGCQGTR